MLATRPPFLRDSYLNDTLFSQYSAYFDDRFGGRQRLISLNSAVNNMLGASTVVANDKALKGKGGWYFYIADDNPCDFYKQNLFTEDGWLPQPHGARNRKSHASSSSARTSIPCIPNTISLRDRRESHAPTKSPRRLKNVARIGISWAHILLLHCLNPKLKNVCQIFYFHISTIP